MEISGVNMEIVSVDQMENGILVNFKDGVCAFFDAVFLYTQMDKRLTADFGDTPSGPLGAGMVTIVIAESSVLAAFFFSGIGPKIALRCKRSGNSTCPP